MKFNSLDEKRPEIGQKVAFLLHGYEFRGEFKGIEMGKPCFYGNQSHIDGSTASATTLEATMWRPLDEI